MPVTAPSSTAAIFDVDPRSENISASLGNLGLSVGSHATRTNIERETYVVRRFLAARLCNGHLRDAGRLTKHESPDFLFQLRNGKIIGIEVTEASDHTSHALYVGEENATDDVVFARPLPLNENPTTHLADLIAKSIVNKVQKTRKEHWTECTRNEVVIYPNYYHSTFCADDRVLSMLKTWHVGSRFDMTDSLGNRVLIHILFGQRIIFDIFGSNESLSLTRQLQ